MRAVGRLSAMAVGTLTVLGAVPVAGASAATAVPSAGHGAKPAAGGAEPATEMIIEGQAGDYISRGFTGVAVPPGQTVTASGIQMGGAYQEDMVTFSGTGLPAGTYDTQGWGIGGSLLAPTGSTLKAGTTYANAVRSADATHPGIEILSGSRGCNQTSGSFTINQIAWSAGVLTQLEAVFTQSCDGGPGLKGVIRYNATGALPPGAPTGAPPVASVGTVEPITYRQGMSVISDPGSGGPRIGIGTLPALGDVNLGRAAWTPLGTRLLFASGPGLTSVRPDGGDARPVTETPAINAFGNDEEPAVSPDGGTVVFVQGGGGGGWGNLMASATDGSQAGHPYKLPLGAATVCQQEHFPSFAPDQHFIFECDPNGPGTIDTYHWADGGSTLLIANAGQAAYSPDGTKIAFVRRDAGGVPQVFTVAADGSTGLTQVTKEANGAAKPAWSPDGKYLAYVNETFHEIVEIPSGGGAAVGSVANADDPVWTPPAATTHVVREWGNDRVSTAVAASQINFAEAGNTADPKRVTAGAVVVSRSDQYADALGGSSLAVRKNAPLLITGTASLDPAVAAEIHRVLKPGGTVYLLGGTVALSPAVAGAIAGMGYNVTRLAGPDRYATAVTIARAVDPTPKTVLVATGANFPDALAAGATGEPLVLTNGAAMPTATASYLNTLNPAGISAGGTDIFTVGGPGDAALIAGYQGQKMPSWPSQIIRYKLAGNSRYDTALLVAQTFFGGDTDAALATGLSWPDALSGGAMIGHRGGPLLLTDPSGATPGVLDYLRQESGSLYAVHLLGGLAALPAGIANQAAGVIGVPGHVQIDSLTPGGASPLRVSAGRGSGSGSGTPSLPAQTPAGTLPGVEPGAARGLSGTRVTARV